MGEEEQGFREEVGYSKEGVVKVAEQVKPKRTLLQRLFKGMIYGMIIGMMTGFFMYLLAVIAFKMSGGNLPITPEMVFMVFFAGAGLIGVMGEYEEWLERGEA